MTELASYARQVQIDAEMWIEIDPGGTYRVHPDGGIVVLYPGKAPRWCRMENGSYRSSELPPDDRPVVVRLRDQPRPERP